MAFSQLDALAATDSAQLLYAQAKITYVGLQSEPVATVLFSVYTIAPRIDAFVHDQSAFHYGNDRLPMITTFTVKHAEFQRFLKHFAATARESSRSGGWASVAVMPDVRRSTTHELLLDRKATEKLLKQLMKELGPANAVAQQVLGDFLRGP